MALWIGRDCLNNVPDGVTELWGIVLNPMTANAELGILEAVSDSRDELISWVRSQVAPEPYRDGQWLRTYINGPLWWCNPPHTLDGPADEYWGHGVIKLSLVPQWVRTE